MYFRGVSQHLGNSPSVQTRALFCRQDEGNNHLVAHRVNTSFSWRIFSNLLSECEPVAENKPRVVSFPLSGPLIIRKVLPVAVWLLSNLTRRVAIRNWSALPAGRPEAQWPRSAPGGAGLARGSGLAGGGGPDGSGVQRASLSQPPVPHHSKTGVQLLPPGAADVRVGLEVKRGP